MAIVSCNELEISFEISQFLVTNASNIFACVCSNLSSFNLPTSFNDILFCPNPKRTGFIWSIDFFFVAFAHSKTHNCLLCSASIFGNWNDIASNNKYIWIGRYSVIWSTYSVKSNRKCLKLCLNTSKCLSLCFALCFATLTIHNHGIFWSSISQFTSIVRHRVRKHTERNIYIHTVCCVIFFFSHI